MKWINCISGFLLLSIFWSCHTPGGLHSATKTVPNAGTIENPDVALTLLDHLRKVPGVQVRGVGENAIVTIRGINSIRSGTEPLFVLNGQPMFGGLRSIIQAVPVADIKSIRVLKNPAETGIYGVRGANGVIEITTK